MSDSSFAAQLSYMQNVLGVRSIIVPEQAAHVALVPPLKPALAVRTRGILQDARLIAIWARAQSSGSGEAEILAEKMVSAMKVQPSQVFWIDWVQGEGELPTEIHNILATVGSRPVLVFGEATAAPLIPLQVPTGRWTDYRGVRYMITLSPEALLESSEKKKIAWAHLQIIMKEL
jgi:hypothetical protein